MLFTKKKEKIPFELNRYTSRLGVAIWVPTPNNEKNEEFIWKHKKSL